MILRAMPAVAQLGRATLAGQVKGEHPDKERYTGRWASTSSPEK